MINFRLANIKRKDTKIYKIRSEREDIATATKLSEIKRVIMKYYAKLCANGLQNLDKMCKFLIWYKQ